MEMFFLLTEVILVGFGLLALTMLGIIAMEKALAANAAKATARLSKVGSR